MSDLRNLFLSLIKKAEETEAEQASLQLDLGGWQAQLSVRRKKVQQEKGGES
jgi:hypothetical protein